MRYYVRMADDQEREWELPALAAACREGRVGMGAHVRTEHQDFWYPVAELLGDSATRPLWFACGQCRSMIHSRRIDIGNPVQCPQCHLMHVVPDVRRRRRLPRSASAFEKARTRVVWGVLVFLAGVVPVAYWYFHPRPGFNADRYPLVFTVLVFVGLELLIKNWKAFRRGEKRVRV